MGLYPYLGSVMGGQKRRSPKLYFAAFQEDENCKLDHSKGVLME